MIGFPSGTKVWLAAGITDMRRGFDGLATLVQCSLLEDPFSGHVFVFRGRKGDRIKVLAQRPITTDLLAPPETEPTTRIAPHI